MIWALYFPAKSHHHRKIESIYEKHVVQQFNAKKFYREKCVIQSENLLSNYAKPCYLSIKRGFQRRGVLFNVRTARTCYSVQKRVISSGKHVNKL